jgi:uncharacterized protein YkwD
VTSSLVRVLLLGVVLAACDPVTGETAAQRQRHRDAFPPPGSNVGTCRDGRSWSTSEPEQARMLQRLNAVRAAQRRQPLVRHAVLDRMALAHAADMACRNYVGHRNSAGDKLPARLDRVNDGSFDGWTRLAEVLGTSAAPERQVERWLDSRSHRRAVLQPEHDRVGIGVVRIAGSKYSTYWAVEFTQSPARPTATTR